MKTKKLIKANLKTAAFLMFAAAMTNGFTACDSDSEMEDADRPSQEAPAEEPHSNAIGSYDDLAILLNTIAETDETGKVTNRHFGKPLDDNDTTHLYIGVNELEEAKDMFQLWLLNEFDDNGETVLFACGEPFYATPGRGKNEVRLAYTINAPDIARAIDILKVAIEKYNAK